MPFSLRPFCQGNLKSGVSSRRPVISSWSALLAYVRAAMAHEAREQFRVLFLDKKNQLIADEVMNHGTVDHAPVYPREVARRSLELSASAVILVHNHPSGDPTPSGADIDMTRQVVEAVRPLRIGVHDHLVERLADLELLAARELDDLVGHGFSEPDHVIFRSANRGCACRGDLDHLALIASLKSESAEDAVRLCRQHIIRVRDATMERVLNSIRRQEHSLAPLVLKAI